MPAKIESDVCAVEGCDRIRQKRGRLCSGHQSRLHRHGDLKADVPLRPRDGRAWTGPNGYFIQFVPGHPLASASGKVYVNRAALFEKVGPGPLPCHWCGTWIVWRDGKDAKHGIHADHVDGDKSNNGPSNLVVSCPTCNATRANAGNPVDWSPETIS